MVLACEHLTKILGLTARGKIEFELAKHRTKSNKDGADFVQRRFYFGFAGVLRSLRYLGKKRAWVSRVEMKWSVHDERNLTRK